MTLVDTSAWIEFFRTKGEVDFKTRVADLLSIGEAAYTCPIWFELFLGARPAEKQDLSTGLGFAQRIILNSNDWDEAATLGAKLRAAGHSVPTPDLLIAIVASDRGIPLLTRDQHFAMIKAKGLAGLILEKP